jgi:hypothetical protein
VRYFARRSSADDEPPVHDELGELRAGEAAREQCRADAQLPGELVVSDKKEVGSEPRAFHVGSRRSVGVVGS